MGSVRFINIVIIIIIINVQITALFTAVYIYGTEVCLSSGNEWEFWKYGWRDIYLREGGANLEETPDNQSKDRYHMVWEVKMHPPTGIEPSPSNIGDKFAWSESACSNPLNE